MCFEGVVIFHPPTCCLKERAQKFQISFEGALLAKSGEKRGGTQKREL